MANKALNPTWLESLSVKRMRWFLDLAIEYHERNRQASMR